MKQQAAAKQGVPLANWGHEWLTHERYEDLEACFQSLVARGYQGLIIDPSPHLVAANEHGEVQEHAYVCVPPLREFIEASSIKVQPRARLLSLLHWAKEHQVDIWFSSSFLPDSQARRSFIRRPEHFVKVWADVLNFAQQQGVGGVIKGVDFCQGFPLNAYGAYRRIFRRHPFNPLGRLMPWDASVRKRIDEYLLAVPRALRALFPQYQYGISAAAGAEPFYHDLSTSELDFYALALWQDDDIRFQLSNTVWRNQRLPLAKLRNRMAATWHGLQQGYWAEQWQKRLQHELRFCAQRRLTPMLFDGYLKVVEEDAYWPWVREFCQERVQVALAAGVRYLVVSHYARPSNDVCWQDDDWLREVTQQIQRPPKQQLYLQEVDES